MAAIYCPVCGKGNFENSEICQFCGTVFQVNSEETTNLAGKETVSIMSELTERAFETDEQSIEFQDMQFQEENQNLQDKDQNFEETEEDYLQLLENMDPESIKLEDLLTGEENKGSVESEFLQEDTSVLGGNIEQENVSSLVNTSDANSDETNNAANASLDWLHSLSDKSSAASSFDGLLDNETAVQLIDGLPAWLAETDPSSKTPIENTGLISHHEQEDTETFNSNWHENFDTFLPDDSQQRIVETDLTRDAANKDLPPQINIEHIRKNDLISHDYLPSDGTISNSEIKSNPEEIGEIPDWLADLQNQDLNSSDNPVLTDYPLPETSATQEGLPDWFINLQNKLDELSAVQDETKEFELSFQSDESNNVDQPQQAAEENEEINIPDSDSLWTSPFISEFTTPENGLTSDTHVPAFEKDTFDNEYKEESDEEDVSRAGFPARVEEKPTSELVETPEYRSLLEFLQSTTQQDLENEISNTELSNDSPLSGIESILPSATAVKGTASGLVNKVSATDTQNAQAYLLKNLILSENTPINIPVKRELQTNHRMRWLISTVLVVSILITTIIKGTVFPTPAIANISEKTKAFYGVINGLPEHSNILFVTDYQPSFAGEIELIAKPVIDQLMSKNASISFISNTPTGVYLSDRLISVNAKSSAISLQPDFINLGYLPGGAGGIRAFSEKLLSLEAAKFAAIIVATDNPDTGRLWIEQFQNPGNAILFLLITSSQSEMMIQPYFSSLQVVGILSGLEGAVIYEKLNSVSGSANHYWNSFGIGIIIFELILIIGLLWNLTITNINRRKTQEGLSE